MKNEVKKFEVGKAYWAGNDFANSVLVIKERKGKKVTFDVVSKKNIFDAEWNVIGREAYVQYADVCKTVTVGDDCDYEMISYKVPYSGGHRITTVSIDYEVVGGSEGLDAFQEQILAEVKLESKERAIKATENMSNEELLKNISNGKWTIHCIKFSMENSGITSVDELYFNDREKYAAATARLEVYEKAFNDRVNAFINAMAAEMVDDDSNDDAEENVTTDYNFDVEEDDDELVDPPIENHIEFKIPAALELVPVTFEVERFGSEKIDADAFIADKIRGIAEYQANIDAISAKITELDKLYSTGTDADGVELDEDIWNATYSQMAKLNRERAQMKKSVESINFRLEELLNSIVDSAKKTCYAACGKKLVLIAQDGTRHEVNTDSNFDIQHKFNGDESALIKVSILPHHKKPCDFELLGYYNTVKAFNAAIEGLTAKIERGDEVYTFPADDEEINAEENAPAKIDTAITEVPIDEDAEIKALESDFDAKTKELVDAHKPYCKSVDEIDKQISELETQLEALKEEREKRKDARFNNWYDNGRLKSQNSYLKAYIAANVHISADAEIILKTEHSTNTLFEGKELGATLSPPNGEIRMWTQYKGTTATLVYYKSFEEFKAAIEGLTAAIERGDDVYTFPTNA